MSIPRVPNGTARRMDGFMSAVSIASTRELHGVCTSNGSPAPASSIHDGLPLHRPFLTFADVAASPWWAPTESETIATAPNDATASPARRPR